MTWPGLLQRVQRQSGQQQGVWLKQQQKNSNFDCNSIGGARGCADDSWVTHTPDSRHENALWHGSENNDPPKMLKILGPDRGLEG